MRSRNLESKCVDFPARLPLAATFFAGDSAGEAPFVAAAFFVVAFFLLAAEALLARATWCSSAQGLRERTPCPEGQQGMVIPVRPLGRRAEAALVWPDACERRTPGYGALPPARTRCR